MRNPNFIITPTFCPNSKGHKHHWVEPIGKNAKLLKMGMRKCKNCGHVEALTND